MSEEYLLKHFHQGYDSSNVLCGTFPYRIDMRECLSNEKADSNAGYSAFEPYFVGLSEFLSDSNN